MEYRLLDAFEAMFRGNIYRHRNSSQGDRVAQHLYEDLQALGRSKAFTRRVANSEIAVNVFNKARGFTSRRGDGTLGEVVAGHSALREKGFAVARGQIANVEIGTEVKVLSKAMIKQIDRVKTDLVNQASVFRRQGNPICIAVVGINYAPKTTSYEKEKAYPTDGREYPHPIQEAAEARKRILEVIRPVYDELLILPYLATNEPPFDFQWVKRSEIELDYGAILTRISIEYDRRFGTATA